MTAADASRFQFALSGTRQGVCCFGGVLPSLAGPLFVKAENFSLRPGALSLSNKDRSCPGILLYFFIQYPAPEGCSTLLPVIPKNFRQKYIYSLANASQ